ncbi:MAG: B12-binding domain-containing radical SAM protein, partial [Planctomycetaceae bacterium]
TPLPGTNLRKRLEAADRIIDYDWSHYDCFHAVFQPLKVDRESLEKGLWDAYREFYSTRSIFQ